MATYEKQCYAVGSFGYADNFKLYVVLNERDVAGNSSKVDYDVYAQSNGSGSINANHFKYFSINGQEITNVTEKVVASSPNAYIHIASGTTDAIEHDSDGRKTIGFYSKIEASSYGISAELSGNFELTDILTPSESRANFNSYSIVSTNIDTVDISYSLDRDVYLLQVSINNGEWQNVNTISGNWYREATTRISGLNPNSQYNFRLKANVNGNDTITNYMNITTKEIAKITKLDNFNFGDNIELIKYNPSGYKNIIRIGLTDTIIKTIEDTSDTMNIGLTQEELDKVYKLMTSNDIILRFYVDTVKDEKIWTSYKDVHCFLVGNAKTVHILINSLSKRGQIWIKDNDIWKRGIVYIKDNEIWKKSI